jgi:hypothetical protein
MPDFHVSLGDIALPDDKLRGIEAAIHKVVLAELADWRPKEPFAVMIPPGWRGMLVARHMGQIVRQNGHVHEQLFALQERAAG